MNSARIRLIRDNSQWFARSKSLRISATNFGSPNPIRLVCRPGELKSIADLKCCQIPLGMRREIDIRFIIHSQRNRSAGEFVFKSDCRIETDRKIRVLVFPQMQRADVQTAPCVRG